MPDNSIDQSDALPSDTAENAVDNASSGNHHDGPTHVAEDATAPKTPEQIPVAQRPTEVGGQKGLEPTRYGDWEKRGRCTDF